MKNNPFDHNGECLYCDELGGHTADCPWWLAQLQEHTEVAMTNNGHSPLTDDERHAVTTLLRSLPIHCAMIAIFTSADVHQAEMYTANLTTEQTRHLLQHCLDHATQSEPAIVPPDEP